MLGPLVRFGRSFGRRVARGRDGSSIAVAMNHGSASCRLERAPASANAASAPDVDSRRFAEGSARGGKEQRRGSKIE